jgi:hypothetical protein
MNTLTEPGAGNPKESDKEQARPVVEETPQPLPKPLEKRADRPHPITIALGMVSPTVAIVALLLSFKSLEMSRRSLDLNAESQRIAQRAYLGARLDIQPKLMVHDEEQWGLNIELNNTGNTPSAVSLTSIDILDQFKNTPQWQISNYSFADGKSFFISGKDKFSTPVAYLVVEPDKMKSSLQFSYLLDPLVVSFRYSDVFLYEHYEKLTCRFMYSNDTLTQTGCSSSAWDSAEK